MPVQVIITGNDSQEAVDQMAAFLGLRKIDVQIPQMQPLGENQAPVGNGLDAAGVAGAEAPKRRGRKPKDAPAEQTAATESEAAEAQEEQEQQDVGATIEQAQDAVRDAMMSHYVERYGRDATQADMAKLYKIIFKDGSVSKVTDIPEGMHGEVIKGIIEMAEKNPFKRKDLTL